MGIFTLETTIDWFLENGGFPRAGMCKVEAAESDLERQLGDIGMSVRTVNA
jgi:hypothetical protein|tara:strand:+ start:352 stop:504 length:153 start_codon:yes stop_codon:yes gene_type:complete